MVRTMILAAVLCGLASLPLRAEDVDPGNAGVSGEADFRMYCASCHGEDGKGDGPKSFGLSMPTPDLTLLTKKYGAYPTDRLVQLIDGREALEGHLEREMPAWGVWFKEEAAAELGGAEGDEGSVKRRIGNLLAHIESLQQ